MKLVFFPSVDFISCGILDILMVVATADTHTNKTENIIHFQVLGLCACKPRLDLGFSV